MKAQKSTFRILMEGEADANCKQSSFPFFPKLSSFWSNFALSFMIHALCGAFTNQSDIETGNTSGNSHHVSFRDRKEKDLIIRELTGRLCELPLKPLIISQHLIGLCRRRG